MNIITPEFLIKRGHNFYPEINEKGEIDLTVLGMFSKGKSNMDIAKELIGNFPQKIKSIKEALTYVGNLAEKYSK